jgi:hypothetical protein
MEAVFRCLASNDNSARQLEIPQWMFDRARCCLMRLAQQPLVSVTNLRALHVFLRQIAVANSVEDQHRPSTRKRAAYVNWAILDLSAIVCTIKDPGCQKCPLRKSCQYAKRGTIYSEKC